MGNCILQVERSAISSSSKCKHNKDRKIATPATLPEQTSYKSLDTLVIDEHEWSLVQYAHKQCRKGDRDLEKGDLEAALANYKLMLHIPPQITNSHIAGLYIQQIAMGSAAKVHMLRKQYDDATQLYELALNIAIDIEDKKGEGIILLQLSLINKDLKRFKKAAKQCRSAVEIFRELGDRTKNEGVALINLGDILSELGSEESKECTRIGKEILSKNESGGDNQMELVVDDDKSRISVQVIDLTC